jgi:hypothetical protein
MNTFVIALGVITFTFGWGLFLSTRKMVTTKLCIIDDIVHFLKDLSLLYVLYAMAMYYDEMVVAVVHSQNEIIEHMNVIWDTWQKLSKGEII